MSRVLLVLYSLAYQSPWIPELAALFEDCKSVAPGNAGEMLG